MTIIVYGSTTGNTEAAAEKIAAALGDAKTLAVADAKTEDLQGADRIILGTSTWGVGDIQDDWESGLGLVKGADLAGKKAAVFGLGDQDGYPDSFVDGMKDLEEALTAAGAEVTGRWSTESYSFDSSRAAEGDHFVGLALDEDNQSDLTDQRIADWLKTL